MNLLTEENYLKTIYRLSQKGSGRITPTTLAEEMSINAASVVDMIKKLSDKKLIRYDKQKGVKLTRCEQNVLAKLPLTKRLTTAFTNRNMTECMRACKAANPNARCDYALPPCNRCLEHSSILPECEESEHAE